MSNARNAPAHEVRPEIILLEEYPALAAAISSALKKFAPGHSTHVARSLKELESLADQLSPELLLIDVDPPWPKLTQLLVKFRDEYPKTRALVIGATIPAEIIDRLGHHRALQFLHKPFDVPELGAAVQALVGPWTSTGTEELRGTLRCFNAVDAALLQCASGRSVVLEISKGTTKSGELHFVNGQLRHAENGRRSGIDALEELLGWKEPELKEKDRKERAAPKQTIQTPWPAAFVEALRNVEAEAPTPATKPPAPAPPTRSATKTGKRVVLIDDTDMLLLFVEDVLATKDPSLRITTASTGTDGVRTVAEIQPDLVLLDYSLPDFNGDEVCRRLLADKRTASIPILMMSGHVPEMRRTASECENVVATIEKPFLSEALVTLVKETLATPPKIRPRKPVAQPAVVTPAAKPKPEAPQVQAAVPARVSRPQRSPAEPVAPAVAPVPPPPPPVPAEPPRPIVQAPAPPAVVAPPLAPMPPAPPLPPLVPTQPPRPVAPPPVTAQPPVSRPVELATPTAPSRSFAAAAARPVLSQPASEMERAFTAVPILSGRPNDIVLGLFLEVTSLQLTPTLRMGTVRARPSSQTVSLQVTSPGLQAALPPTGFQLGPIDLDRNGRIAVIRLKPTVQPFTPMSTRNSFQIGGVSLVPFNSHERLQLTPAATSMRMQLVAHLETAGVELSESFQISSLILRNRHNHVRVSLSAEALTAEKAGTACEIVSVQIDNAAHITELTLAAI